MSQKWSRIAALVLMFAWVFSSGPAVSGTLDWRGESQPQYVLAADSLNLESDDRYSTEYIFGMTKGVMRSTLEPALKPPVLILTVPLDIAFLPFAAIGGFFR